MPVNKTLLVIAAVPLAVGSYIAIAGTTGFCPACTGIMDSVLGRNSAAAASAREPGTLAGLKATALTGETVALDSFVGKPVILDFWATWCGPCKTQRAILAGMEEELQGNVHVIALSMDSGGPSVVRKHIADTGHASQHELMASTRLAQEFGVSAIPTLVFVDATGKIRKVVTGVQTANVLRREIALLK